MMKFEHRIAKIATPCSYLNLSSMFEIVSLFGLMVSALLIVNTTKENKLGIYLSLFFLTVSVFR